MRPGAFRARIHWIDKKTGQEGVYVEEPSAGGSLWETDGGISTFMWAEGNYSCDCNREIFFLKEHGLNVTCGSHRFIITKMEALNEAGELVKDLGVDESRSSKG
jgi:hypothetical protein